MSETHPRSSYATGVRAGTRLALGVTLSLVLTACNSGHNALPTSEKTVPPAQATSTVQDPAFADHDPHAWDYLLEPPDFSQVDVVAVPAAEPDKPDAVQPAEAGTKD